MKKVIGLITALALVFSFCFSAAASPVTDTMDAAVGAYLTALEGAEGLSELDGVPTSEIIAQMKTAVQNIKATGAAVLEAYGALSSEEQEPYVVIVAAVEFMNETLTMFDEIIDYMDKIYAIEDTDALTLADKDKVVAARAAYDALVALYAGQDEELTEEDAKEVLDFITAAEAKMVTLQAEADAAAIAADQAAAKAVSDKIAALGTITLSKKADVKAARDAYDSLTVAQKALVSNYATLTAAESKIDTLDNPKTGSMAPLSILVTLAAAAGALLVITKKRAVSC